MADNPIGNVKRSVNSNEYESTSNDEETCRKRFKSEGTNQIQYHGVDFDTSQEAQLRCLMRTGDAGAIIGKGGSNIKRLRSEYNLSISLPNSMSIERVLTMGGSIKNLGDCLYDCFHLIYEDKAAELDSESFDIECRVLIHSHFIGGLIGVKGDRIREIRERTKADIKIYEDACPGSTERVFKIDGSVNVVISCVMYVLYLVNNAEMKSRGNRRMVDYDPINNADLNDGFFRTQMHGFGARGTSEDGAYGFGARPDMMEPPVFLEDAGPVTTVSLTVAAESAGAIIGSGGRNINVARQRSGADIKVEDGKRDGNPRQVTITGNDSQIQYAKFLIQQFVKEDRAWRGGGEGGSGSKGSTDNKSSRGSRNGGGSIKRSTVDRAPRSERSQTLSSNGDGNTFTNFQQAPTPVAASSFGYAPMYNVPPPLGTHPSQAPPRFYPPAGNGPHTMSSVPPGYAVNTTPGPQPFMQNMGYGAVAPPYGPVHGYGY